MPLPGKLSIGILEEDNPQKSYFRLKPLLIQEGGRFAAFDGAEAYPKDGCIRIVPDKNESGHFKARMRRIGLYVVVDLRDHPGEHDKIRANKNYGGDGGERNAYIIYSDVVREPAPGELFALLSMRPEEADGALLPEPPDAPRVLLYCDGALQEDVWTVEAVAEQESFRLVRAGGRVDPAELQVFELKGFQDRPLSFAVLPPEKIERAPEPVRPARAAEPARLTEPIRLPDGFHIEEEPAQPAQAAQPAEPPRERAEVRAKEAEAAVRAKPEKAPPAREARPAPRDRANASQVGLNPRKGRCLQEIIDDKWRFSRMEQLGAPTPSLVTGEPVRSPADAALDAVRTAWNRRDQREALVGALAKLDGLDGALNARRAALRASAVNEQLNELEAQRLKMLDEMEHLKRLGADVRASLKQEILCEQADEFADVVARIDRARAECARSEEEAARSRETAESVQDAINAMADGRFEERLREFAINSRAVMLLKRDRPRPVPPMVPCVRPDAEALIARVIETFAAAGAPLGRAEAVNLLVCAAQGSILLISGAPGSGKTSVARLLARALGVEDMCFASFAPADAPLDGHPAVRALAAGRALHPSDAPEGRTGNLAKPDGEAQPEGDAAVDPGNQPDGDAVSARGEVRDEEMSEPAAVGERAFAMALLDDANLLSGGDPTRGLTPAAERGEFLLCMTVQDDGEPVPAHLLGRAFTLRLSAAAPDAPWKPAPAAKSEPRRAVSAAALRRAFAPKLEEMPEAQCRRMEKFRADLALLGVSLSRKTLDALWNYCAAAIPAMPLEPSAVLDLALAQRAIPAVLASAPLDALAALTKLLDDLPHCAALLKEAFPVQV